MNQWYVHGGCKKIKIILKKTIIMWNSYIEWRRIFPSYHKGGAVSVIFLFGQIFYNVTVLHLEKKKDNKNITK